VTNETEPIRVLVKNDRELMRGTDAEITTWCVEHGGELDQDHAYSRITASVWDTVVEADRIVNGLRPWETRAECDAELRSAALELIERLRGYGVAAKVTCVGLLSEGPMGVTVGPVGSAALGRVHRAKDTQAVVTMLRAMLAAVASASDEG